MNALDLNNKMVWVEAHNYTRAGIWYLRVINNTCILSDEDGNTNRFPVGTVEMREANVGELIDAFFENIFPGLKDKKEELMSSDQAKLKVALATLEVYKKNAREIYVG